MSSEPILIKEFSKRWLFGLISVEYDVEDRRPDLTEFTYKFKHYIVLHVFGVRYSWLFHTLSYNDELTYTS